MKREMVERGVGYLAASLGLAVALEPHEEIILATGIGASAKLNPPFSSRTMATLYDDAIVGMGRLIVSGAEKTARGSAAAAGSTPARWAGRQSLKLGGKVASRLAGPLGWGLLAWDIFDTGADLASGDQERMHSNIWIMASAGAFAKPHERGSFYQVAHEILG